MPAPVKQVRELESAATPEEIPAPTQTHQEVTEPTLTEEQPEAVETPRADIPAPKKNRKAKAEKPVGKPNRSGLIPALLVVLFLILGGGAAMLFGFREMGRNPPPPNISKVIGDPLANEASYIRIGWQKDAYQLLQNYLSARSAKEKLPFVLNSKTLTTRIEDFYGGGVIVDSDTPAEAFSVYELSEDDRKRGLFMMIFDQPPQFEMKEFFRPLASLEVQYGVDEADLLLSTVARVGNFAMEPLHVHAFFKRTSEGLKLDWELFAQTKYRTLQNFVELPEVGQTGVFRVFIIEDVPDKRNTEAGTRTYRIADPANTTDTARINVKIDSEIGRALSIINWRGIKEGRPITRTATVELKWSGEPNVLDLEINRFICWEFLGLGGQETPATASTK
ncbi:MAG: hypothetical protein H8M99_08970 [Gloeobacteraceae cyanobacterium ES-bin-144]|nr:hypothetical protein [Verrucomicrobiales bacterium]